MHRCIPQVAKLSVPHFVETAGSDASLNISHQVDPQGNFRTVKGRLLDEALGAVGHVSHHYLVLLVGGIAEEVALEDG